MGPCAARTSIFSTHAGEYDEMGGQELKVNGIFNEINAKIFRRVCRNLAAMEWHETGDPCNEFRISWMTFLNLLVLHFADGDRSRSK